MYVALIGLAFSSPDLSNFCQQLMMGTNLLLTAWILYQGYDAEPLKAWQISNPTGGAEHHGRSDEHDVATDSCADP